MILVASRRVFSWSLDEDPQPRPFSALLQIRGFLVRSVNDTAPRGQARFPGQPESYPFLSRFCREAQQMSWHLHSPASSPAHDVFRSENANSVLNQIHREWQLPLNLQRAKPFRLVQYASSACPARRPGTSKQELPSPPCLKG